MAGTAPACGPLPHRRPPLAEAEGEGEPQLARRRRLDRAPFSSHGTLAGWTGTPSVVSLRSGSTVADSVNSLDLPIQSLILNDLARSLASSATASSSPTSEQLQTSPSNGTRSLAETATDELVDRVRTDAEEAAEELEGDEMLTMVSKRDSARPPPFFLGPPVRLTHVDNLASTFLLASFDRHDGSQTTSSTHINTSFALFSSHLPLSHPRSPANLDLLLRMLADVPRTEFEAGLAWAEWALPDQLTSAVVGALLKISDTPKEQRTPAEQATRERVIDGIAKFIGALDDRAQKGDGPCCLRSLGRLATALTTRRLTGRR